MKLLLKALLLLALVSCQNNRTEKSNANAGDVDKLATLYFTQRPVLMSDTKGLKKTLDQLAHKYRSSTDSLLQAKLNYFNANYCYWSKQDSLSQIYFRKSIPVLRHYEKQTYLMLIDGLHRQGIFYYKTGDYNTAAKYFKESVYYSEKYFNQDTLVPKYALAAFEGYGSVNRVLINYTVAKKYLNKTIELSKKLKVTERRLIAYTDLALIYSETENLDQALAYNKKAEELALAYHPNRLELIYNHYASIYYTLNDWENVLRYLKKEYEVNPDIPELEKAVNLSGTYLNLKKPDLAKPYIYFLEKEYLKDALDDYYRLQALERLPKYYIQTKDYQKADTYFDEFAIEQKYFYDTQNLTITEDFIKKYDLKEKEDEIALLDQKNKLVQAKLSRRNTMIFIALLTLLLVITIAFLLYFQQRNRKLKLDKKLLIMEDTLLRSQMEPHFVYNALSSLQGLIYENKNQLAVKYLSKFARLLRLSLEHSRMKFVPFTDEIEAIESYLDLQKMRFGNKFSYFISGELDGMEQYAIPPLMIQPFVENAIYHGFANIDYEGKLQIAFEKHPDYIYCIITDNGLGIDASKNNTSKTKTSLSTAITIDRLKSLAEGKNQVDLLTIQQNTIDSSGTIVCLRLPFIITV